MSPSTRTSLTSLLVCSFKPRSVHKPCFSSLFFSTSTRYPLQYEMVNNSRTQPSLAQNRRRPCRISTPDSLEQLEPEELDFDLWSIRYWLWSVIRVDTVREVHKRRKRLYGSDSEDESWKPGDGFIELKMDVLEFDRLH